jgi:DnaJ-class molecular chaperone
MNTIECWDCEGDGRVRTFTSTGLRTLDCPRCMGAGEVPEIMAEWFAASRRVKEWRLANRVSQRAHAESLDLTLVEYSRMAAGFEDPVRIIPKENTPPAPAGE